MYISFNEKPFIRFGFTFSYTAVLLILFTPYLWWEIYWAKNVGYLFIKWHTHLATYVYLWFLLFLFAHGLNNVFKLKNYVNYQLTTASVCCILLLLEAILLATGTGDTYMEKIKFGYASRYNAAFEKYYRTHNPNEKFYINRPEFNYVRHCNSLGFSDVEWTKTKSKKHIFCSGDSFTEGVGAPFDSCYVSVLRAMLSAHDTTFEVMNAGIAGDDPCVNFVACRDLLTPFQPYLIVQTISSNDMNTDIAVKGGLERFQKDGTIKFPTPPWWEPIYALSYVSRIFFSALGYNELLLKIPFTQQQKKNLDIKAIELFAAYDSMAKNNGTKLLVVLQPCQKEIYDKDYEYDFAPIVKQLHALDNVCVYDLLPYYINEFANSKDDIRNYYWNQDGHHNSKGYHLMAQGVYTALQKEYPKIFATLDSERIKK